MHLVWAPLGVESLERFLRSYNDRSPGLGHRLLVVLNGFAPGPLPGPVTQLLDAVPHDALRIAGSIQDLAAYRLAAEQATWADSICFVNSHAQPLADGWLAFLHKRLHDPGVGIVGATGSHESTFSAAPRPLKPLRALQYPPFPNPHLRTNGFMLRRDDLLALDWRVGRSKSDAHRLESGRRGITRQLAERGLDALVVDRDGRGLRAPEWAASRTFRSADQERLLIADNRTRQYADAAYGERAQLAQMAWGASAEVSGAR